MKERTKGSAAEGFMQVVHGKIGDVYGQMHSHGNFGFVNAAVTLSGRAWSVECEIRDFPDLEAHPAIESLVRNGIDTIWVIGRIKAVFGDWIELSEGEKSILNEGFVAHSKQQSGICVPFVLCDHYLRTGFMFGATLKDEEMKRAIARSFYELLLAMPTELQDFDFRKHHIGAGITMVGGIANGQVQYDEEP